VAGQPRKLPATQKESSAQNKPMKGIEYISHTEQIVKASWSRFHHGGAAASILSERSPWPPAMSVNDLLGELAEILNVPLIQRIDWHP